MPDTEGKSLVKATVLATKWLLPNITWPRHVSLKELADIRAVYTADDGWRFDGMGPMELSVVAPSRAALEEFVCESVVSYQLTDDYTQADRDATIKQILDTALPCRK